MFTSLMKELATQYPESGTLIPAVPVFVPPEQVVMLVHKTRTMLVAVRPTEKVETKLGVLAEPGVFTVFVQSFVESEEGSAAPVDAWWKLIRESAERISERELRAEMNPAYHQ
jgi:hypothetical protein